MKPLALACLASLTAACSSAAPSTGGDGGALDGHSLSDTAARESGPDAPSPADASAPRDGAASGDGALDSGAAPDGAGGLPSLPAEVVTTRKLCSPPSSWVALPYPVAQAAYSRAQERLILLPRGERALHIFDPVTCEDRRIPLSRTGLSISVHPDGKSAVVGQDGHLTTVDLVAGTTRTHSVFQPATDVALDADGIVRLLSYTGHVGNATLRVVRPDGTQTAGNPIDPDGHLRRPPDGRSLFWVQHPCPTCTADDLARVDLAGGRRVLGRPIDSCHDLFFTDDSQRLVTACGSVLRLSTDPATDLQQLASLEGGKPILSFDSDLGRGRAVAIERAPSPIGEDDTFVQVYDPATWKKRRSIRLPSFSMASPAPGMPSQRPARGRHVFVRGDGTRYHVLASSSTYRPDNPTDAVATLAVDGPDDPGLPPLAPNQVDPEAAAFLPPFEVVRSKAVPLGVDIVAAGFSRAVGRLVVASTTPDNAVILIDPDSGDRQTVPLARRPQRLFVREDGAVAAVVHDAGLLFLDLMTRTVLWSGTQLPRRVSFGPPPLVMFDDGENLQFFDLQAGKLTGKIYLESFPPPLFAAASGTASVYRQQRSGLTRLEIGSPGTETASHDLNVFQADETLIRCAQDMWLTRGGEHLVLACGRVFRLSPDASQDLRYVGSLDRYDETLDTIYSKRLDRFLSGVRSHSVPAPLGQAGTGLVIHEPRTLGLERRVTWQSAESMGSVHALFEASSGRVYVLAWNVAAAMQPTVVVGLDL